MPLTIGQTLHNDRYRIVEVLGQGGMGAVYKAWDTSLNMHVAIKENLDSSQEAQKQFGQEARMLARLSHPNLPRVTDYFFIENQGQYLVMDYIAGEDLESMLNRMGTIPEGAVIPWVTQICDALQYLHNQQPPIIHRDIKPANIRISSEGRVMLVDFGIAKVYDPTLSTTVGARAVTPGYSPPEQYGSGKTDERTDIYALGATMYHLLTGKKLPESVHLLIGDVAIPPPRQLYQVISPPVEAAILRCIEVDTRKRFQSVAELTQSLAQQEVGAAIPATERVMEPVVEPTIGPPVPSTKKKSFPWILLFGIGGIAIIVILVLWISPGFGLFSAAEATDTLTATATLTNPPPTGTPTRTASPTLTRTPAPTRTPRARTTEPAPAPTRAAPAQPTRTQAPTAPLEPILSLDMDYHCRGGPGSNYEILRDLKEGERFKLYGWNGSDWFLLKLEDPSTRKQICWVGGGSLIQGDLDQLPVCQWTGDGYTADPSCR